MRHPFLGSDKAVHTFLMFGLYRHIRVLRFSSRTNTSEQCIYLGLQIKDESERRTRILRTPICRWQRRVGHRICFKSGNPPNQRLKQGTSLVTLVDAIISRICAIVTTYPKGVMDFHNLNCITVCSIWMPDAPEVKWPSLFCSSRSNLLHTFQVPKNEPLCAQTIKLSRM